MRPTSLLLGILALSAAAGLWWAGARPSPLRETRPAPVGTTASRPVAEEGPGGRGATRRRPPRLLVSQTDQGIFARVLWRELETTREPAGQAARLAHRLGFDADQSAHLDEILPPFSRSAALAAHHQDPELARAVERELKRVLLALASTEDQIARLDDLFGTTLERTP